MMKTANIVTITVLIALALCLPAVQNSAYFVNLDLNMNGKTVPPPPRVTLTLGKHSMPVPVINGRFEVPQEIALANQIADVSFFALIGGEQIRFSVDAAVLRHENWSLRLADGQFEDQYQSLIHKGEASRSVCVLVFSGKGTEASVLVAPHCRSKLQK